MLPSALSTSRTRPQPICAVSVCAFPIQFHKAHHTNTLRSKTHCFFRSVADFLNTFLLLLDGCAQVPPMPVPMSTALATGSRVSRPSAVSAVAAAAAAAVAAAHAAISACDENDAEHLAVSRLPCTPPPPPSSPPHITHVHILLCGVVKGGERGWSELSKARVPPSCLCLHCSTIVTRLAFFCHGLVCWLRWGI